MVVVYSLRQELWARRATWRRHVCTYAAMFALPIAIQMPVLAQAPEQKPAQADELLHVRELVATGRMSEAIAELRPILQANPSADAHFLMGYIDYRQQQAKESLAEYTAGAQLRRPGPYELKVVAEDYILLQDLPDADKWLTEVTKETPNDADAWYLLGRTKYNENSFAEAITCFERVLELRPKDVLAEDNLGLSQQGLGENEKAKAAYRNAIAWQGESPREASPFLNLGILLLEQGSAQEALSHLHKAVELAPQNPKAREELSAAYEELKMEKEAVAELEAAVKLAPEAAGPHFKLARLYRKLGMTEDADREYAICAKLNSEHSSKATPNPPEVHRPQ